MSRIVRLHYNKVMFMILLCWFAVLHIADLTVGITKMVAIILYVFIVVIFLIWIFLLCLDLKEGWTK